MALVFAHTPSGTLVVAAREGKKPGENIYNFEIEVGSWGDEEQRTVLVYGAHAPDYTWESRHEGVLGWQLIQVVNMGSA